MRTTFEAISAFGPAQAAADNRDTYPGTSLGRSLATAAQIIRGDVGVEVITVDQGDWDMHTDMGGVGRRLDGATTPRTSRTSIAAFFADLGTQESKVTLVTLSEFGRRVVENDSDGTDHGYGNVMFVAGAGVRGGYHARWPGLANSYDVRPHGHHRLPPGARRHRLEAVQRLGREGLPRAEAGSPRGSCSDPPAPSAPARNLPICRARHGTLGP